MSTKGLIMYLIIGMKDGRVIPREEIKRFEGIVYLGVKYWAITLMSGKLTLRPFEEVDMMHQIGGGFRTCVDLPHPWLANLFQQED